MASTTCSTKRSTALFDNSTPTRPALRYFGGKWRLAPWIISHFPAHRTYVEPFGGAASVLLRKVPAAVEVYNDLDDELVEFFNVLRCPRLARELRRRLRCTPYARTELAGAYVPAPAGDRVERARRLVIRSMQSFHPRAVFGIPTVFSSRGSHSPAASWAAYAEALPALAHRLRSVVVENRQARDLIAAHDSASTLFYVDPPYVRSTRTSTEIYRHELADPDHRALLTQLASVKGFVALSGYGSDLYRDLLPGWQARTKSARVSNSRLERVEVLWLSPRTAAAIDG